MIDHEELLDLAAVTISDRGSYGNPRDNFTRTAHLWTAYLDHPIRPDQVATCLALLKISRAVADPNHLDNRTDATAYLALAAELLDPTSSRDSGTQATMTDPRTANYVNATTTDGWNRP